LRHNLAERRKRAAGESAALDLFRMAFRSMRNFCTKFREYSSA
jgi:hypothetical protein